MRRFILALAAALALPAADLRIDHVTVAGLSLAKMTKALGDAGIRAEPGGRHNNRATEMALVSFPDGSYLELIAVQPDADWAAVRAHYWFTALDNDAGPTAWAVRTTNLGLEALRIRGTGVSVAAPVRAGRTRPDGAMLEWQTANVGIGANGSFFPFMIQDFTPRELRAMPSGKPTNTDFEGVAKVVIAVGDLKQSITRFRRAYALPEPKIEKNAAFGATLADFEGTPLILAEAQARWLQVRLAVLGEAPCAFILKGAATKDYKFRSKTTWFGREIQWFDDRKLGWRLGVQ